MKLYKPTPAEKAIIRDCAQRSAGYKGVEINPSTKISLNDGRIHMNIAMISDDPDFGDTDLFDNAYRWSDFVKGVEMTSDGKAIVDFYVYNRGYWAELKTNVTAYIEGGQLVRVEGTGANRPLWQAGAN